MYKSLLKNNTIINCRTKIKANELLTYFHFQGLTWSDGDSLLDINMWNEYKETSCYKIWNNDKIIYSNLEFYKNHSEEIITLN